MTAKSSIFGKLNSVASMPVAGSTPVASSSATAAPAAPVAVTQAAAAVPSAAPSPAAPAKSRFTSLVGRSSAAAQPLPALAAVQQPQPAAPAQPQSLPAAVSTPAPAPAKSPLHAQMRSGKFGSAPAVAAPTATVLTGVSSAAPRAPAPAAVPAGNGPAANGPVVAAAARSSGHPPSPVRVGVFARAAVRGDQRVSPLADRRTATIAPQTAAAPLPAQAPAPVAASPATGSAGGRVVRFQDAQKFEEEDRRGKTQLATVRTMMHFLTSALSAPRSADAGVDVTLLPDLYAVSVSTGVALARAAYQCEASGLQPPDWLVSQCTDVVAQHVSSRVAAVGVPDALSEFGESDVRDFVRVAQRAEALVGRERLFDGYKEVTTDEVAQARTYVSLVRMITALAEHKVNLDFASVFAGQVRSRLTAATPAELEGHPDLQISWLQGALKHCTSIAVDGLAAHHDAGPDAYADTVCALFADVQEAAKRAMQCGPQAEPAPATLPASRASA